MVSAKLIKHKRVRHTEFRKGPVEASVQEIYSPHSFGLLDFLSHAGLARKPYLPNIANANFLRKHFVRSLSFVAALAFVNEIQFFCGPKYGHRHPINCYKLNSFLKIV